MAKKRPTSFAEHQSREGLKRATESHNPLYLWQTIAEFARLSRFRSGDSYDAWRDPHAMTEMPNWVMWHLERVARAFAAMGNGHARDSKEEPYTIPAAGEETIRPAAALSETLRVLHLMRPGWNAFAAYRRDRLRENAVLWAVYYEHEREELRRYLGLQTDRALSRELSLGRRALPPHERKELFPTKEEIERLHRKALASQRKREQWHRDAMAAHRLWLRRLRRRMLAE
jgi:hypothetical protein